MKKIVLSPSKLSLFKECKHCFWLDVNKGVKRPSGIFPSLPGGMDLILKKYFDEFRCDGCLPPDIENELDGHLFDDLDKLKVWRNNFKGLQYTDEDSGIGLRGALDDLFVTDEGFHILLDFKTRGFPLKEDTHKHYQHQMDLYCYLLDKNGMKTSDFACLVFYHPTKVESGGLFRFKCDVIKLKADKKDGEKLFMDAIEVLQRAEPECSDECEWYGWNSD